MILDDIDNEVVFLKAINELIDSMANFEVFELRGNDPNSSIFFRSMTHQKYFNIILVDFLSGTDRQGFVRNMTFLSSLRYICQNPSFDIKSSIVPLRTATEDFVSWLEQKVEIIAWLPSINTEAKIIISRISFIKICGNISKHNFLRSIGPATDIQNVLANSAINIGLDEALLVLEDFYERFHTDIFNYHGSTIAEFLNNIRWGIYDYLQPEWNRAIVWDGGNPPMYKYIIPASITTEFVKECYWSLMNEVRSKPFMRRFKVDRYLKMRY